MNKLYGDKSEIRWLSEENKNTKFFY